MNNILNYELVKSMISIAKNGFLVKLFYGQESEQKYMIEHHIEDDSWEFCIYPRGVVKLTPAQNDYRIADTSFLTKDEVFTIVKAFRDSGINVYPVSGDEPWSWKGIFTDEQLEELNIPEGYFTD